MADNNMSGRVQEVLTKAAVDREFRTGLLTDPRTTLEKLAGQPLPESLRVKFIERDSDCDAMFVLPDPVAAEELTSEELEAVAGGLSGITIGDVTICWETEKTS